MVVNEGSARIFRTRHRSAQITSILPPQGNTRISVQKSGAQLPIHLYAHTYLRRQLVHAFPEHLLSLLHAPDEPPGAPQAPTKQAA